MKYFGPISIIIEFHDYEAIIRGILFLGCMSNWSSFIFVTIFKTNIMFPAKFSFPCSWVARRGYFAEGESTKSATRFIVSGLALEGCDCTRGVLYGSIKTHIITLLINLLVQWFNLPFSF